MTTQQLLDAIFHDSSVRYQLTEFEGLEHTISEILEPNIIKRTGTGRQTGKTVYFIKPFCAFHSGKTEFQIYADGEKSKPEEIVRQLWVWKLINYYGYSADQIRCEIPVQFGSAEATKFADIAVYRKNDLETVKILFEVKKPKRKDGIEQLKSYLGAQGNPIGVWSNGADKLILYKPDNKDFDTLPEIPRANQDAKDVLEVKRTLDDLHRQFNFKKIVQDLEELVLADSGVDEFNEIFKLIYAKIYDEKTAAEDRRRHNEVLFKKFVNPQKTYETINELYQKACEKWPGVFEESDIKLRKDHLQVCIGPLEYIRLLGSNLRIMDDAFEYLMPSEAKKKKGQFFTPRHVIEMCVRMLNPKEYEYVIDPSCGSAGFLLHAMQWAMPAVTPEEQELRKTRYAEKFLWGIDFEARAAKTSRALMLIAGDGHSNIFGPDVSSIDPKTWYNTKSGKLLMGELSRTTLLRNSIPESETFSDENKAWDYFSEMNFDIVLANPPFAGELKDKKMLMHYQLAEPAIRRAKDKQPKEERDVIFIERIINLLRPGGRAAIVLPQGKFNNSSLAFIREFIMNKARVLAVVGLHNNTFKPHTGTKTSVIVLQKYTEDQLGDIQRIKQEAAEECPDYSQIISELIEGASNVFDIDETTIPSDIMSILHEEFPDEDIEEADAEENAENPEETIEVLTIEERVEQASNSYDDIKQKLLEAETRRAALDTCVQDLIALQKAELAALTNDSSKTKKQIAEEKKIIKVAHKDALTALKQNNKEQKKAIDSEIKILKNQLPILEEALLKLTLKGRLQIILNTPDVMNRLRNRFIDAEVARRLDYPIFMAVSEHGGKNNSGDYEYLIGENGSIIEDSNGNPEIDQDLVNHSISRDQLIQFAKNLANGGAFINEQELCIAEAFVQFAVQQNLDFWRED